MLTICKYHGNIYNHRCIDISIYIDISMRSTQKTNARPGGGPTI